MKLDWKAVLGIAITVFLLWFVLREVPYGDVLDHVRAGDMRLLAAAVGVATAGFVIRAMRWRVLLAPLREDTTLHNRFAAVSIGFMANNLLPARIGEFARAYALSRLEPVSASGAFGTLVVERVLDGLTLLAFLLFAVSWSTFPASGVLEGTAVGTAVDWVVFTLVVLTGGMIVLLLRPRPFVRIAERAAARLPGDFARPLVDALEAFLDSLDILRRPWLLLQAVLWSVGFWLFHGVSFYLGMLAFGIRPPDPFVAALFTEAVVGFGVAVPSAPGFFGTFHWAADWALSDVYGVESARSLAFAFGYHFGGWIPITFIGMWYAGKLGLSLGDVRSSEARVEAAVEADHPDAARLLNRKQPAAHAASEVPGAPLARGVGISAPAKVNLALHVMEKDADTDFHEIETLFQAVGLADEIRIEVSGSGLELEVEGMDVGPTEENLVWQAARSFIAEVGVDCGLRIDLTKRIPAGAGLGGGSSDAAATLRALNALFGDPIPTRRLSEMAADLGSDVPFFLAASPFAVGRGRGDRLTPLEPLPPAWILVAVPDVHVSTARAYGVLDRAREEAPPDARSEELDDTLGFSWERIEEMACNDFEGVVADEHGEIARVRELLAGKGARLVLLSGSGSAVFAVYEDRHAAEGAADRLREHEAPTVVHVVQTLTEWPSPTLDRGGEG
jgi:4-diphosphocytidyl-2C-methyl-D-erythritol kinase